MLRKRNGLQTAIGGSRLKVPGIHSKNDVKSNSLAYPFIHAILEDGEFKTVYNSSKEQTGKKVKFNGTLTNFQVQHE